MGNNTNFNHTIRITEFIKSDKSNTIENNCYYLRDHKLYFGVLSGYSRYSGALNNKVKPSVLKKLH